MRKDTQRRYTSNNGLRVAYTLGSGGPYNFFLTCKRVTIHQSNGWPWETRETAVHSEQLVLVIAWGSEGMLEIEAVAVEFWRGGGGDDYTHRVGDLQNVQSKNESIAEVGTETVVWWRDEGEKVDEWHGLSTRDGAVGVRDWEGEKYFVGHVCEGLYVEL